MDGLQRLRGGRRRASRGSEGRNTFVRAYGDLARNPDPDSCEETPILRIALRTGTCNCRAMYRRTSR